MSSTPREESVIDRLLEANARYAAEFSDSGLSAPPAKQVAVVACMDARLDLPGALGLGIGDFHTLRNAGGAVTDDVIRSLTVSQRELGTRSVMVIHHSECGMIGLSEDFRDTLADETGQRPMWAVEGFKDLEADVRQSVERVRTSVFLPYTDDVRGFVLDVRTGELREVVCPNPPGR
jgi:carbonic anhydrase